MAQMYPQRPSPDTKSQAELKLFSALEKQLSDDYVVFHSVAWQVRDTRNGVRDGETDFLILHPDFGILLLEVKGGRIRYNGSRDQWYSNNKKIKDPFKQGRNNKYSLLEKLGESPRWSDRWVTVGYAAAFPDVAVKNDLRFDAPRQLILDAADMMNLQQWVDQALDYLRGQRPGDAPLGAQGVTDLITLLSPSWDLRPVLAAEFATEGEELVRLTREQFVMLDFLKRHRRVAISGCAGSGKTTLAYEKARRLAEEGFQVLLTCFNVRLAEALQVAGEGDGLASLHVANFHRLAHQLVRQAGLPTDPHNPRFFDEILPEQLMEAIDMIGTQFDAIIVDEGQDVGENWWIALQCLLHDPDQGILYVFFDDNQAIYQVAQQIPLTLAPFPLTRNCRNTRHIHQHVMAFYRSDVMPVAIGPQGRPVERHTYTDLTDLKRHLRQILHRLVIEEEVPAWDIVLLTPKGRERSDLWGLGRLGNFRLTDQQTFTSGEIYCSTVHNFKGLESPVVILAELGDNPGWHLEALLYVGCSRARNHLILLLENELPERLASKLSLPA